MPLQATLMVADAAQASHDGKMHLLGAGWALIGTPTPVTAVAFFLHVPWDEANRKIQWTLDLLTADGGSIVVPIGPNHSTGQVHVESEFEVGRPPGLKPGSTLNVPFAITIGPLPLAPDSTFEWVLAVGKDRWTYAFATRPA